MGMTKAETRTLKSLESRAKRIAKQAASLANDTVAVLKKQMKKSLHNIREDYLVE